MGGAHEAIMTFFAPTSRAIWMISLEVVPRTIESEVQSQRKSQQENNKNRRTSGTLTVNE